MNGGNPEAERHSLLRMSLVVTAISVAVAWAGARYSEIDLASRLKPSTNALLLGVAVSGPLLALFFVMKRLKWRPIQRIFDIVKELLGPAVSRCSTAELIAVSLGAGVSEELLFRGLLTEWTRGLGVLGMLVIPNLLFAALHAVTPAYAVFAFGIGLYLSAVLHLVPNAELTSLMTAHAVYDLICFLYLRHKSQSDLPHPDHSAD